MKTLWPLWLVALFLLIPAHQQSASARQGTLERSILGSVVEQREKSETRERSVVAEIRLDTPVDGVELELPKELVGAATLVELASWRPAKGKDGITWTSDRPVNLVRLRIDLPPGAADKLDKALKNGLSLKFKLGEEAVGTQSFNVAKADAPGVINDPAQVGLPPRVHEGFNSFLPPEGYTNGENGTWRARAITVKGAEELPISPVVTREEMMVGADYRLKNPLDLNNLSFPGRVGRPKDPFHDPTPPLGFLVPPGLPPGTFVEVTYVDRFGNTVVGARVSTDSFEDRGLPPFLITCTPKIFAGDYLCVCGFFPTQFSRNQLLLDGKPLGKLAGSKDTIVFQPKGLKPGRHVVEWNVQAFSDPFNYDQSRQPPSNLDEVAFVLLEVRGTIDQNALFTGQGTTLRLRIIGSEERLPIELTNKTPQVVDVEGGLTQVIQSSGGANNTVERRVKGTMRGNFNIVYRLALPPCPCDSGLTAEVTGLTGQVGDEPQTSPGAQSTTMQTTTTTRPCEMIFQECSKAEAEVYRLESEFEKAYLGCDKGRGANDAVFRASCKERTSARYLENLKEAYLKELLCYRRWQECVKSQQAAAAKQPEVGTAANVPSEDTKPERADNCDDIESECGRLKSKVEFLDKAKIAQFEKCGRIHKGDPQAAINCRVLVNNYYKSLTEAAEKKLSECRERLAACRAKRGGRLRGGTGGRAGY